MQEQNKKQKFPRISVTNDMKKFSFPTENRQFLFEPKNPYDLAAERRVPRREDLTFPDWCAYEESNPDFRLRKPALCPLSYRRKYKT